MSDTYIWSTDGEWYHGSSATVEEAFEEAVDSGAEGSVWIGITYEPAAEAYVDAELVLEHIACQDEYAHEAADDWPNATQEQLDELTAELQKTVGEWLDRHKLRERFFLVRDAKKYVREDGAIVEVKGGAE